MDKSFGTLITDTLYEVASHLGTNLSIFSTGFVGGFRPGGFYEESMRLSLLHKSPLLIRAFLR